jgi:predicted HTH transcriptional regulator
MDLRNLIAQGENQQVDFKFEITDAKKIARSLVAFANTDGGKLLIGVKDNGSIAGVRSEEEIYMIDAASELYTKPKVPFTVKQHIVNGKKILEIDIQKSTQKPHSAPTPQGDFKVYIRVNDQNLLANSILLNVWKTQNKNQNILIRFTEIEKILFEFLEAEKEITISKFCKIALISKQKAQRILTDLIVLNLVKMKITEKNTFFLSY